MTDRAAGLRWRLIGCESIAASIDADQRLPKIRSVMTDPTWQHWMDCALDSEQRAGWFENVRVHIEVGNYDEAESMLRLFESDRQMLSQLAAQWDATAQTRRARQPRRRSESWAKALASHLAKTPGGAVKAQVAAIPAGSPGLVLPFDGGEIEVYRDGNVVICDGENGVKSMTLSSLHRHHLRKS